MSAATFLSPSLPVVLTLITVLTVLWVIAFASKVATKRLAKEEGDTSGLEMSLYWLHTLTSELATVFAIPLLPYLFFIGVYWVSMNDSGTVFRALKAFCVVVGVLILLLAAVLLPVLWRLRKIEKGATESDDLESNREYQALKALDNKLGLSPEVYACLAYSVMPILLFLFAVFVLKL